MNFVSDFFWQSVLTALVAGIWFGLPGFPRSNVGMPTVVSPTALSRRGWGWLKKLFLFNWLITPPHPLLGKAKTTLNLMAVMPERRNEKKNASLGFISHAMTATRLATSAGNAGCFSETEWIITKEKSSVNSFGFIWRMVVVDGAGSTRT
ncbi:MAG: hypothetical protein HC877_10185 [Thioploca sp.]|nr:hypothetical protein [Thioploca sp.]